MRNEIKLTDDAIEAVFDDLGLGVTIEDIEFSRETIADWIESSAKWAERRGYEVDERSGYSYVFFPRAQVIKGQPRTDIYVIDFGAARAIVH